MVNNQNKEIKHIDNKHNADEKKKEKGGPESKGSKNFKRSW